LYSRVGAYQHGENNSIMTNKLLDCDVRHDLLDPFNLL
jgi:hypothetical protein